MKVGPELDALISKEIMGVQKMEAIFVKNVDQVTKTVTAETRLIWPPYSTEIDRAFEVVDKMKEKLSFELTYVDNSKLPEPHNGPPVWLAHFSRGMSMKSTSAAHAICLAALCAFHMSHPNEIINRE